MQGVSENFPLLCGRVFGLWGTELSLSKASANYNIRFGDINTAFPCFLVRWNLFGCSLILQHTKEWSVLPSALW